MTKEKLQERLAVLQKQHDQLHAQRIQISAQINACVGAMQDCQFWMIELDKEQPNATGNETNPNPTVSGTTDQQ